MRERRRPACDFGSAHTLRCASASFLAMRLIVSPVLLNAQQPDCYNLAGQGAAKLGTWMPSDGKVHLRVAIDQTMSQEIKNAIHGGASQWNGKSDRTQMALDVVEVDPNDPNVSYDVAVVQNNALTNCGRFFPAEEHLEGQNGNFIAVNSSLATLGSQDPSKASSLMAHEFSHFYHLEDCPSCSAESITKTGVPANNCVDGLAQQSSNWRVQDSDADRAGNCTDLAGRITFPQQNTQQESFEVEDFDYCYETVYFEYDIVCVSGGCSIINYWSQVIDRQCCSKGYCIPWNQ